MAVIVRKLPSQLRSLDRRLSVRNSRCRLAAFRQRKTNGRFPAIISESRLPHPDPQRTLAIPNTVIRNGTLRAIDLAPRIVSYKLPHCLSRFCIPYRGVHRMRPPDRPCATRDDRIENARREKMARSQARPRLRPDRIQAELRSGR